MRPGRVVYTEIYAPFPQTVSVVTAEFVEEGHRTRLVVTVEYPSSQVRDQVVTSGMEHGAAISYDRLEDLVARLA